MLVAFVLLLVVPPLAAEAATITTGALPAFGGNSLRCRVANTGTSDANAVTIELIDTGGTVTGSVGPVTLPAGTTVSESTAASPGTRWCRVRGISKAAGRVTLCVIDSSDSCIAAVTVP